MSHYSAGSQESDYGDPTNFELSEFLMFDEWIEDANDQSSLLSGSIQNPVYRAHVVGESGGAISPYGEHSNGEGREGSREKKGVKERVAFKTKSEIEILDDGFKWRKYGKKMVKNSPNPRNYYRCSVEGCPVKKRVERDKDDLRFVITTYEGIHNHPSSC
ncbi:probable WRKY transcription factor 50 isoform X2 [Ricinus communis]|uniref:WRKY transcription factor, putative n=1 Tax=Ricinus communis TaxID=3988 RepID=B9RQT5_RICCO|nr:probable WRKY transcription factor 50 isoform X2 [Ricinus communis]EEF46106.1 WRKY transcription factor, putative [Ricinus communis]|eukprot:XP_002516104.1 probable WRKY transcription factor 50 isoform X2 [Ricinus communis]